LSAQPALDECVGDPDLHEVAKSEIDPPVAKIDLRAPEARMATLVSTVSAQPAHYFSGWNAQKLRSLCRRVHPYANQFGTVHDEIPNRLRCALPL
jgi:hypothetical protein